MLRCCAVAMLRQPMLKNVYTTPAHIMTIAPASSPVALLPLNSPLTSAKPAFFFR